MAEESLSQSRKRKSTNSQEHKAKRIRENNNNRLSSDDDNELVAGKIKRIFMKNFMCHDAMEVDFNQKVNFIVGANGSGKSAILTALTVGLGARAKDTNRGSAIKGFIKKGKSSAQIEITVTNDGPMAYKYEVYGGCITVIRNISETTSSYKINNWRGEKISTKRNELERIINYLNIQVDNPISVLNQDVARTFLAASSPDKMYKLFMRGTRLDKIRDNYQLALEVSEVTKFQLEKTHKTLKENEKEISLLEKKIRALESLTVIREEYQNLQNEALWAKVIQEEKKLLGIDSDITEQEKQIEKFKNMELNKATKEKEIDLKIEELKKEIAEAEAEAKDGNEKLNNIKKKCIAAKKVCEEKKEKTREFHADIKRKESDTSVLQNEIKKLERESGAANERRQNAKQEIIETEQQLDEVEATLRTKQTDLMHFEENKMRIEQEDHKIKINVDQKHFELNKLQRRLADLKNQPNDALTVYGSNMPRLLRRIEEEYSKGRFIHKPVGPLGSFMKLKDSSWIPAVENHLGIGTLSSFCVDNSQDARVLNLIMNEVYRGERPPQISISKFFNQMHDVSQGCTRSSRYLNLLDAMEISHPVVANCLIDEREIECVLLIPTSDEACSIMSDERKVPENCKRAITKNADLFFPDPNYRTYGGSISNRAKFLQVSTSDAIQALQEEISIVEDEFRITQQEYSDIQNKMKKNMMELRQVQQQVRNFTSTQQRLRNRIDDLKEIIERCNNNMINTYITELEELQRIIVQKKEEEGQMMEEVREAQKNFDLLNSELKNCRNLTQNLDAKLNPIKEKIKELKDEKNRLSLSNQNANRRITETKQQLQILHGVQEQQQRVVNQSISIAEKACPRINTTRTIQDIEAQAKGLKLTIQNVESQHGNKENLVKEFEEKNAKYSVTREFAIQLNRSIEKHEKRLNKRKVLYALMKKKISETVKLSFSNALSLRNYKGRIEIDHSKKELYLEVAPANDAKRPTTDAKALSGGERSYSTVSFVLALWDCTALPFYFLDEFDVFMDKINRRVIMDILLAHAQSHPQCQFAFLTPLDTSHIQQDDSITIHRLAAPERST